MKEREKKKEGKKRHVQSVEERDRMRQIIKNVGDKERKRAKEGQMFKR